MYLGERVKLEKISLTKLIKIKSKNLTIVIKIVIRVETSKKQKKNGIYDPETDENGDTTFKRNDGTKQYILKKDKSEIWFRKDGESIKLTIDEKGQEIHLSKDGTTLIIYTIDDKVIQNR